MEDTKFENVTTLVLVDLLAALPMEHVVYIVLVKQLSTWSSYFQYFPLKPKKVNLRLNLSNDASALVNYVRFQIKLNAFPLNRKKSIVRFYLIFSFYVAFSALVRSRFGVCSSWTLFYRLFSLPVTNTLYNLIEIFFLQNLQ